ncbi:hypothetical protein AB9E30_40195, partial [Rhizobium leguminosarum]
MFKDELGDTGTKKDMRDGVETAPASFEEASINPDIIRREGFASEAEYRAYIATLGDYASVGDTVDEPL